MAMYEAGKGGPDAEELRKLMGPGHVDQAVRQALQMCWMALPGKKKTVDRLEGEFRRLVERALRDLREDEKAFEGRKK